MKWVLTASIKVEGNETLTDEVKLARHSAAHIASPIISVISAVVTMINPIITQARNSSLLEVIIVLRVGVGGYKPSVEYIRYWY